MLLRRLIRRVEDQNWLAVGIDFVIVVVGVFIGIQVSNANTARSEAARVVTYLEQIENDLQLDLAEVEETLTVTRWRIAAIEAVLEEADARGRLQQLSAPTLSITFGDAEPLDGKARANIVFAATLVRTVDGRQSAYEALISTGELRLFEDRALVRSIQQFYAGFEETTDFERSVVDNRNRVVNSLARVGLARANTIGLTELGAYVGRDPQLEAELCELWLASHAQVLVLTGLNQAIEELRAAIREAQRAS